MNSQSMISAFKVKFDQLAEIKFQSCSGMQFYVQPVYYPDSGLSGGCRTGRGKVGTSELGFSVGTVDGKSSGGGSKSVSDWLFSVINFDEKLDKRNGRVTLCSSDGETLAQWKILNAWPCRWDGPSLGTGSNSLSIDTITFAHEGLERVR